MSETYEALKNKLNENETYSQVCISLLRNEKNTLQSYLQFKLNYGFSLQIWNENGSIMNRIILWCRNVSFIFFCFVPVAT